MPTLEINDVLASRLADLRDAAEEEMGISVTEEAILYELVASAQESPDELIESLEEGTVPLSEEERERMNEGTFSSGVETDEEDIDEILYGEEHNP
ncbi:hypothetical protein [Halosimplex pelagicum]|uniref:Uncharacterized protein n=1 Tax=Halosimplex pelagicum TaxID=869886 RepID=A0A7D5P5Q4_9EURY|nr:hypothetical protein [Halosimplex pelagicum]QLH81426.1 hypothetical protein HZS54_07210 [Halosimplex pelagicum]